LGRAFAPPLDLPVRHGRAILPEHLSLGPNRLEDESIPLVRSIPELNKTGDRRVHLTASLPIPTRAGQHNYRLCPGTSRPNLSAMALLTDSRNSPATLEPATTNWWPAHEDGGHTARASGQTMPISGGPSQTRDTPQASPHLRSASCPNLFRCTGRSSSRGRRCHGRAT
jgi:hypothetical protein